MATFFMCVASNAVFAGALAVLTMALTRVWRSPHLAHALWLLVLIKLVTPPIVPISVDRFIYRQRLGSEPAIAAALTMPAPQTPATLSSLITTPEIPAPSGAVNMPAGHISMHGTVMSGMNWPQYLLATWIAGTLILFIAYARRHGRVISLLAGSQAPDTAMALDAMDLSRHIGLAACPSLRVTDLVIGPFVTPGIMTATVVLPRQLLAELNREQVKSILAHELIHIRRHDHWVRVFTVGVLLLNWWNPIAWWASRQVHQAEEECCDAWVVWALPGSRRTYGQTLLAAVEYVERDAGVFMRAGTPFGGSGLRRRIHMILKHTLSHRMSGSLLALVLLISSAVLPVGVLRAVSEDTPEQLIGANEGAWQQGKTTSSPGSDEATPCGTSAQQTDANGFRVFDSPLHAVVRTAWSESAVKLKSGKGEAEWKVFRGDELIRRATVDVQFNGPRFRLTVSFDPSLPKTRWQDDRRIVIGDESVLVYSRFSPRFQNGGCQMGVLRPKPAGVPWVDLWMRLTEATEGLEFCPNVGPHRSLLPVEELSHYAITRQADGALVGTGETKLDSFKFVALPDRGLNCVQWETVARTDPVNSVDRAAGVWEQQAGAWFMSSSVLEDRTPQQHTRQEFRYSTFTPNCPVDDHAFGLETLLAPDGADITFENGDKYIYRTPPTGASSDNRSLLEQLQSMTKIASAKGE